MYEHMPVAKLMLTAASNNVPQHTQTNEPSMHTTSNQSESSTKSLCKFKKKPSQNPFSQICEKTTPFNNQMQQTQNNQSRCLAHLKIWSLKKPQFYTLWSNSKFEKHYVNHKFSCTTASKDEKPCNNKLLNLFCDKFKDNPKSMKTLIPLNRHEEDNAYGMMVYTEKTFWSRHESAKLTPIDKMQTQLQCRIANTSCLMKRL